MGFNLQNNPNERFYNNYFTQANGVWGNRIEILHFDSDWNWLMEVVKKIKSIETAKIIGITYYDDWLEAINEALISTNIDKLYNICIRFIEWYIGKIVEENK